MNEPSSQAPIRILIADDHGIVRDALAALLDRESGIRVLGSAASGLDAIRETRALGPDVVIMDLMLPDMSGIEASQQILRESPDMRIIVLSACRTAEPMYRALRAGARGYVVKSGAGSDLVRAVQTVHSGLPFVSPGIIPETVDDQFLSRLPRSPYERLSVRERDVLRHIVAGSTSSSIASRLCLSSKTVDTYRSRMMLKLGVANRSALIRLVIENEMLSR